MTTNPTLQVPGYLAGTWTIDPIHSHVGFVIKHLMVSKVRGHFTAFTGEITTADNLLDSSVSATIEATSIDTSNSMRDDHIRSADFFDAENHPALTFVSSGLRQAGGEFFLDGNLTIRGITKAVTLALETPEFGATPGAGPRPASRRPPRSTAPTSGSALTVRSPVAASHWARRFRSCWKSKPT
jgi:polyisoprenoid-binding protein YceI